MSKWPVPTDSKTMVAVAASMIDRKSYHRPHWTGSGTHCVNWMRTKQVPLEQALKLPRPRYNPIKDGIRPPLQPCGRCYHV